MLNVFPERKKDLPYDSPPSATALSGVEIGNVTLRARIVDSDKERNKSQQLFNFYKLDWILG